MYRPRHVKNKEPERDAITARVVLLNIQWRKVPYAERTFMVRDSSGLLNEHTHKFTLN